MLRRCRQLKQDQTSPFVRERQQHYRLQAGKLTCGAREKPLKALRSPRQQPQHIPLPAAEAGSDQSICEGETATLSATGGETYLWSTGENTQSITVSPATTTTYQVTVTSNGCSASDEVILNVYPLPNVNLGNDTTLNKYDTLILNAGSGYISYLWNTTDTSQIFNVIGSNYDLGRNVFSVTVENSFGCIASDTLYIEIIDPTAVDFKSDNRNIYKIYPNPTGDKLFLEFMNINSKDFIIKLYNNTGHLLENSRIENVVKGYMKEIDFNSRVPGVYILKIQSKSSIKTFRVIKQ